MQKKYLSAIVTVLTFICLRDVRKSSYAPAMEVYETFKESIATVYPIVFSGLKSYRNSYTAAGLSFCHKAYPDEMNIFLDRFSTGVDLKKGDPALSLRNYLIDNAMQNKRNVFPIATAAMYHVKGEKLSQIKFSTIGIDFFSDKIPKIVNKVRKAYGME